MIAVNKTYIVLQVHQQPVQHHIMFTRLTACAYVQAAVLHIRPSGQSLLEDMYSSECASQLLDCAAAAAAAAAQAAISLFAKHAAVNIKCSDQV
jgi:hypothetical protein